MDNRPKYTTKNDKIYIRKCKRKSLWLWIGQRFLIYNISDMIDNRKKKINWTVPKLRISAIQNTVLKE